MSNDTNLELTIEDCVLIKTALRTLATTCKIQLNSDKKNISNEDRMELANIIDQSASLYKKFEDYNMVSNAIDISEEIDE